MAGTRALRALVLTAGLGTRLRPLTYVRAKGALPVNGEALACRVARWLGSNGIPDLVFNLHHHPQTIAAALGDGSDLGVRVRYSWEDPVLGSAGGPRHALPLLVDSATSRFVIVNGDTLTNVDLQELISEHDRAGALITLALIPNPAPAKYGGVLISPDGYVTRFTRRGSAVNSYHFIGVQVAEARAFEGVPIGVRVESIGSVYPRLIESDPRSVRAYLCNATFHDIGTPSDYLHTSLELAEVEGNRMMSPTARIDESAVVERSVVWDDVTVKAGARLADSVVADGVVIPPDAVFERCAIVPADDHVPKDGERLEGRLLIRPLTDT